MAVTTSAGAVPAWGGRSPGPPRRLAMHPWVVETPPLRVRHLPRVQVGPLLHVVVVFPVVQLAAPLVSLTTVVPLDSVLDLLERLRLTRQAVASLQTQSVEPPAWSLRKMLRSTLPQAGHGPSAVKAVPQRVHSAGWDMPAQSSPGLIAPHFEQT